MKQYIKNQKKTEKIIQKLEVNKIRNGITSIKDTNK